MKPKILNILLVLTSLLGYLEWGKGSKEFLFQTEAGILSKVFQDPASFIHPFIILPLAGQILLLITLFQKNPNKIVTFIGIAGIGLLLGLIFFVGVISVNVKILGSTIPFLAISAVTIRHHLKTTKAASKS